MVLQRETNFTITITIYICIARLYSAVQGRLTVLQVTKHSSG